MHKREDPFVLEKVASPTLKAEHSRRDESHYGVVISSSEENKTTTVVRILFYPQGGISAVAKHRLEFADAPADINQASRKFLENYAGLGGALL